MGLRTWLWDRFAPAPTLSPTCVATVASRIEADMMAGFLHSHGIRAVVSADDAGGVDPILQVAFGVRVLVPPGQADAARAVLGQLSE